MFPMSYLLSDDSKNTEKHINQKFSAVKETNIQYISRVLAVRKETKKGKETENIENVQ